MLCPAAAAASPSPNPNPVPPGTERENNIGELQRWEASQRFYVRRTEKRCRAEEKAGKALRHSSTTSGDGVLYSADPPSRSLTLRLTPLRVRYALRALMMLYSVPIPVCLPPALHQIHRDILVGNRETDSKYIPSQYFINSQHHMILSRKALSFVPRS